MSIKVAFPSARAKMEVLQDMEQASAAVLTLPTTLLFLFYQNPPNFLRASALSEHISPVVVIPVEASSPDSEPIMELVDMETSSQQVR